MARSFDEVMEAITNHPCPVPKRKDGVPKRRGKKLSSLENSCRDVYRVTGPDGRDYALKFARPGYEYSNIAEAGVWAVVKDTPFAPYFAPVVAAAADGSWLLQEFVHGEPAWWEDEDDVFELEDVLGLNDMHAHNFVYVGGTQVAFDYGGYLVRPRRYVGQVAQAVEEEMANTVDGWLYVS